MSTTIKKWYDFVLQQMAAESYLDQAATSPYGLTGILMLGSNNPSYKQDGVLPQPTTPILHGATRMTATQADYFLQNYTIVSHQENTASGFSATLMQDNNTGEYTLSMRSTEYFDPTQGGDWYRDGLTGADGEINSHGFALRQILDMRWNSGSPISPPQSPISPPQSPISPPQSIAQTKYSQISAISIYCTGHHLHFARRFCRALCFVV